MPSTEKVRVSVIGTGDFACALSKRLLENGYEVHIGSRVPKQRNLIKRDAIFTKAILTDIAGCISASKIVLVAIPCKAYEAELKKYDRLFHGRVVVDVSNPSKISQTKSNAERLAQVLPKATVVKAFNTVSAYALGDDTSNEHKQVFVASDDPVALEEVCQLARDMGFSAHNSGRLQKARELEAEPLYLFRGWGWPTAFTAFLLAMELIYLTLVMYIYVDRYDISQIPTYMMYKAFGAVSVNLLAFCYLPGIMAAFAQIFYGTKHKRFQVWLDKWLLGRKQLGIYALLFAFMHMIALMNCMNGAYFDYLFKQQYVIVPGNNTEDIKIPVDTKMNLHGEGCIISGLVALCAMGILGLTSIPPVGAMLNWREWRFIQSQFGFVCFILTVGHCMVHGVPRWIIQKNELEMRNSFTSLVLPWFTILLKIIYFIPCVNHYVWKIRGGYERGVEYDPEAVDSSADGSSQRSKNSFDDASSDRSDSSIGKKNGGYTSDASRDSIDKTQLDSCNKSKDSFNNSTTSRL